LIFSTAAPAAVCAAGLAAIHIVQSEPHRRQQLLASSRSLKEQLRDDFNVGESSSQIIPVLLGSPDDTMKASTALRDAGFLVPGIRPPSVPDGESLLRISLSYDHTPEMIERLVAALKSIKP
jgi:8-amino-7-oxononanoate synthase